MIRTLQKRFIITAQAAVTVLLIVLLAVINAANLVLIRNRANETLFLLSESAVPPPKAALQEEDDDDDDKEAFFMRPPENEQRRQNGFFPGERKNAYDTLMSSNYFIVLFDEDGEVISVDRERTSAVDEQTAIESAKSAFELEVPTGRIGRYLYRVSTYNADEHGTSVVFLDITDETASVLRVLFLSVLVGVGAWALMLLFVILLSQKAIRPIAENMESQKEFITNAGHELKTPLAIIRANTEAMELYKGEDKYSRNIKDQITRLNELMERLLRLARAEEGHVWTPEDLDLSRLILRSAESFLPAIEQKAIRFESFVADSLRISADRARLEELFCILFENAVKYTPEGGEIRARLKTEGKHKVFTIENTCESLPEAAPEQLFDRFYRASSARTQGTDPGGYGIGLSAAKSIVKRAGKSIFAEYLKPDRIRFTVIF